MDSIETPRLLLRQWRPEDREPFYRINFDPKVMEHFAGTLSREESDQLILSVEAHFESHGFGPFAAEFRETKQFIGFVGISIPAFDAPFMPAVEIGWRLDPAFWNRGLATEGARAVLRYAFDVLQLKEVVSFTVPDNLASRRVMEKLGMTRDPADDFDHPRLPAGHRLRRHVLYRLSKRTFSPPPPTALSPFFC